MFPCDFAGCSYVGTRACFLQSHKGSHVGLPSYLCTFEGCCACFKTVSTLKAHLLTHSGEKPFACNAAGCTFRANSKHLLSRHRQTHGEATYVCSFPGCTWPGAYSRGVLVMHSLSKHNIVPPKKVRMTGM